MGHRPYRPRTLRDARSSAPPELPPARHPNHDRHVSLGWPATRVARADSAFLAHFNAYHDHERASGRYWSLVAATLDDVPPTEWRSVLDANPQIQQAWAACEAATSTMRAASLALEKAAARGRPTRRKLKTQPNTSPPTPPVGVPGRHQYERLKRPPEWIAALESAYADLRTAWTAYDIASAHYWDLIQATLADVPEDQWQETVNGSEEVQSAWNQLKAASRRSAKAWKVHEDLLATPWTERQRAEALERARTVAARRIPTRVRKQVLNEWEANGKLCGICRRPISAGETLHLHHKLPVSKGGLNDPANLTFTHAKCNLDLNNRLPGEPRHA